MVLYRALRLFRRGLKFVFEFDKWHISSLAERKYAKDIIRFLNDLPEEKMGCIVEIGSGLGDIIRNVRFQKKTGFDSEKNVLNAASFLSRVTFDKTHYAQFLFPSSRLENRWNTIVMVNWIHHIEPDVLKENITKYFVQNLLPNGCIIIDTVQAENYKYKHNITYLTRDIPCSVIKIGSYENQREIFAIFK